MKRIQKNDLVVVTTGKSKKHVGKVLQVKGDKVIVEGANLVSKHTKPNPQANQPGGIIKKEAFLHVSNVAMYDPDHKQGSKVGFRMEEIDGRVFKARYFKVTDKLVDRV